METFIYLDTICRYGALIELFVLDNASMYIRPTRINDTKACGMSPASGQMSLYQSSRQNASLFKN